MGLKHQLCLCGAQCVVGLQCVYGGPAGGRAGSLDGDLGEGILDYKG